MSAPITSFDFLFQSDIVPELKNADRIRKQILLNYSIMGFVVFTGMAIEAVTWMSLALAVVILFVLFYTRWYGIPVTKYEQAYISAITTNIIQFISPGLRMDNYSHLKLSEIKNAMIITGDPEYFSGKNLIYGDVKGQLVKISEIYSKSKYALENGIEFTHEYFNGLVMLLPNISTEETIMICTDAALSSNYKEFSNSIQFRDDATEELTIYRDNKHSGEQQINAALLQHLLDFHHQFKKNVICSTGPSGTAVAVINQRGFTYFEPKILRSALEKTPALWYYTDMQFLADTIQYVQKIKG